MFNVFKSNKTENLMDAFASVFEKIPENPMTSEWTVVQSRGMKQWIAEEIARRFGVCANSLFFFPRQVIEKIFSGLEPLRNLKESFNEDILFWSVMDIIYESRSEKIFSDLENYIKEGDTDKKLYQLSSRIAGLFDDYQVYRPDMLLEWQNSQGHEDPLVQWQAVLWNRIVQKGRDFHIALKTDVFFNNFSKENLRLKDFPQRISFFGISAMPSIFVQVFAALSSFIDINFFLLTPSSQFFFDIKSPGQIGKIALGSLDPGDFYYESGNPLLSSLGKSGKDFHSYLEDFDYHEPFDDLFSDPRENSDTMLAVLQSDILNLVCRKEGQEKLPLRVLESDTSISVHACHYPMREAQVLKDLLLNLFEKDPDLKPHDIIVMMPDIEAYAPYIEYVFSSEIKIPFSIIDRKRKSESGPIKAFLKILGLRDSRFERKQVLDLLLSESIALKFGIAGSDIRMIEKMSEGSGILWGKDSGHRKRSGLGSSSQNTWQFGFRRLFTGYAMPENWDGLVQGVMPCESPEESGSEVLGKFALFCDSLFSALDTLDREKTVEQWCKCFRKIIFSMMDKNLKSREDIVFLIKTVDRLKKDARTAGFERKISFATASGMLEKNIDKNTARGNFPTGSVMFCTLMPVSGIPFKAVALMGMNEQAFPRQAYRSDFDLIKKYPRQGDKQERDEDRYLFLESLLSARSWFIITYTGMSIKDNGEIPCSGVVSELVETLEQSFVFSEGYKYLFSHPLHPFSERYFSSGGEFFSFSKDNCRIAEAMTAGNPGKSFRKFSGPDPDRHPENITIEEIIRFFRNPVEFFMKESLGIIIPQTEDEGQLREPHSVQGLERYRIGSFLVEKRADARDFYPVFKAMGNLPFGRKGELEYYEIFREARPVVREARLPDSESFLPVFHIDAEIEGLRITGNLDHIGKDGRYFISFGRINSVRLLSQWILHLFLNCFTGPEYPKASFVIARDPNREDGVSRGSFSALNDRASKYLKDFVSICLKGKNDPFAFFPETSWLFVQSLSKKNFDLSRNNIIEAFDRSKKVWYGRFKNTGESGNPYLSLYFRKNDPFESIGALEESGFIENSLKIFRPLQENFK